MLEVVGDGFQAGKPGNPLGPASWTALVQVRVELAAADQALGRADLDEVRTAGSPLPDG